MREIRGDIFDVEADAICVTTNMMINKLGAAVMGRGLALGFAQRYPALPALLGEDVRYRNGRVFSLRIAGEPRAIVSLPTKASWRDPSTIELVEKSVQGLVRLAHFHGWSKVVLPRPGCGLGGLEWADVKKVIEPILDDRFYVITPGGEEA